MLQGFLAVPTQDDSTTMLGRVTALLSMLPHRMKLRLPLADANSRPLIGAAQTKPLKPPPQAANSLVLTSDSVDYGKQNVSVD